MECLFCLETSTRNLLHTISYSSFPSFYASPLAFSFCPSDSHLTLVTTHGDAVTLTCLEGIQDLLQSYTFVPWPSMHLLDDTTPPFFILQLPYLFLRTGDLYLVGTGKQIPFLSTSLFQSSMPSSFTSIKGASSINITDEIIQWKCMDWKEKTLIFGLMKGGMYMVHLN
ncbi:hypothetical protein HMI56_002607 [Coelomomyces lativittatus]|nr:hypothetical protein HMI56_002607 [Coelomomyces lativittatus]